MMDKRHTPERKTCEHRIGYDLSGEQACDLEAIKRDLVQRFIECYAQGASPPHRDAMGSIRDAMEIINFIDGQPSPY